MADTVVVRPDPAPTPPDAAGRHPRSPLRRCSPPVAAAPAPRHCGHATGTRAGPHPRSGADRPHSVEVAKAAGYGQLKDADGIACIDNPGVGGMGIHYANPTLVGDDTRQRRRPGGCSSTSPRGTAGCAWSPPSTSCSRTPGTPTHDAPPSLFGQEFELVQAGNRYGLPPFYELHAWLWKHNPSGCSTTGTRG